MEVVNYDLPDYRIVDIDKLKPYVNNSRTHSEAQINKVKNSIKKFRFLNPLVIGKKEGLIAGHCRLIAALELGFKQLPVISAEHLTEDEKAAYVIADNNLALLADWDNDLLKIEIFRLGDLDFDLDLLGWDTLPDFADEPDYGVLDDDDFSEQMSSMTGGVKKAIQIEFEQEHFERAKEAVKWWRDQKGYVGFMLLEHLEAKRKEHETK